MTWARRAAASRVRSTVRKQLAGQTMPCSWLTDSTWRFTGANPVASPAPKQARSSVRRSAVKLALREAYGYAWRVDDDGTGALVFSTIANG